MVAFSPYMLAITATVVSLSSSALACVKFAGEVGDVYGGTYYITATELADNTQTCYSTFGSGDRDIDCIEGYGLNVDYTDNKKDGYLPATYNNPTKSFALKIPGMATHDDLLGRRRGRGMDEKNMLVQ
ncbi:uncharacterized protein N7459_009597 [Penicillium hispanicum]|uniref:uncharacterized protein n=1 Tax=Penicillium hispanicum TaxID=1080232 RepID=UPI00254243C7|nr:uncharacterized protein N7459_009597 [Penicillium hispanicum]KAJ5570167.1 hypothetical protein N7459_009597 [Penicillium hispanicum]